MTGTPLMFSVGTTSSVFRNGWISVCTFGCNAPTTTSCPRSLRRRPSSNIRNDLPTPDAYPRKTLSRPRAGDCAVSVFSMTGRLYRHLWLVPIANQVKFHQEADRHKDLR